MAATGLTSTLLEEQKGNVNETNLQATINAACNRVLPWVELVPGIQATGTTAQLQKQNALANINAIKDLELDVALAGQSRPPPSGIVFGTGSDQLDLLNPPLEADIDALVLETTSSKEFDPGFHSAHGEILDRDSERIVHLECDGQKNVLGLDVRGFHVRPRLNVTVAEFAPSTSATPRLVMGRMP